MNTAFHVFPWNKPFLPVFKNFVAEASGGKPGQALIITPHMRPARYPPNLYRRDKKARILPKMLAVNELASSWRGAIAPEPLYMANELDQVALLHECLKELDIRSPWTASLSAGMDELESFLPWGLRLAKILEDFAIEGRELKDFPDMSDELGKRPAAILSSLQEIGVIWE